VVQLVTDILFTILAPILLMVLVGALLRWRLRIDITTLGKLNIYLFVPVYVFEHVSTSQLEWQEMLGIFGITVVQVVTLGLLVWGIGRALRVSCWRIRNGRGGVVMSGGSRSWNWTSSW